MMETISEPLHGAADPLGPAFVPFRPDSSSAVSQAPVTEPHRVPSDQLDPIKTEPVSTGTHRRTSNSKLEYFKLIAQWEGRVQAIDADTVTCVVRNLTNLLEADAVMEFPLEEFEESERPEVALGSLFYLNVGYEIRHGTQRQSSFFKLKRLSPPRPSETPIPDSFFED